MTSSYDISDIIKQLRREKGLTQEQLAEGICSTVSISRIENGTQFPSGYVLDAILEKLGTSTYKLCSISFSDKKQQKILDKLQVISQMIENDNLNEAKQELSCIETEEDPILLQPYLLACGTIQYKEGDLKQAKTTLSKALALTKPNIDLKNMELELVTSTECSIINILAILEMQEGRESDAKIMLEELLSALKKVKSNLKSFNIMVENIYLNLSIIYANEGLYKKSLEICSEGIDFCLETNEHLMLPEILYKKSTALKNVGQQEQYQNIQQKVVPYMQLIGKKELLEDNME